MIAIYLVLLLVPTQVDRRDLHRLAAVLTAMSHDDAALDSTCAATRVCHKFRCLSCDRPLPTANNSGSMKQQLLLQQQQNMLGQVSNG